MSTSDGLTGPGDLSFRGRKRSSFFLVLAAGLLLFAAAVGAAFIILRPATLRVAVGPSGSDDQQLIQSLAQNFASEGGAVRLAIVTTAGPVDSIAALAAATERSSISSQETTRGLQDLAASSATRRSSSFFSSIIVLYRDKTSIMLGVLRM
jgi:hypothetical protein